MRWIILIGYLFGVFTGGVFVHEGVHWLQYNDIEHKRIVWFDKGYLAYLDMPDEQVWVTDEQHDKLELEANLFTMVVWVGGGIMLLKHWERGFKEHD